MKNILSKFAWFLLFAMIIGQFIGQKDNDNSVITNPNQGELYQVKQGSVYDGDTIRVMSPTGGKAREAAISVPTR